MSAVRPLHFVGVGRTRKENPEILASLCLLPSDSQVVKTEEVFQRLLSVSWQKLAAGQRQRLQWNDGSVCCLLDEKADLLYVIVTSSMDYPERVAFLALRELQQYVESSFPDTSSAGPRGLDADLRTALTELLAKYDDPAKVDKLFSTMNQIDVVASVMKDNVKRVLETSESLTELEQKTDTMHDSSKAFSMRSRELKRQLWWKNKKLVLAVILIVFVLTGGAGLIVTLVRRNRKGSTATRQVVLVAADTKAADPDDTTVM